MIAYKNEKRTLMSEKYKSMLLGGTVTTAISVLITMSDAIIAGIMLGETAVAGVNLVTPLYSLAAFFGFIFSIGIPIIYSKEIGSFNKKKADQAFGFGLLLTIIIGIIMCILCLTAADNYLSFYNADAEILAQGKSYLFWMSFLFLTLPVRILIAEMIYVDGDEVLTTILTLIQVIANIPLSIFLCIRMGVAGISLASFLTMASSLLISIFHFTKETNTLRINFFFSFEMLRLSIKYSIIDASSYIFIAIFAIGIEKYIVLSFGSSMLIIASIIIFMKELSMVFDGIGTAINPFIGIYLGEKNYKGVENTYRLAKITAILEGLLVSVFIFILAPFVPKLFGITNPNIIKLSISAVRITGLSFVFVSLLYLLPSYYLLIEKVLLGFFICSLRDVVICLPLAIILGNLFGIYGLFIGIMLAPAIAIFISLLSIHLKYGKANYPLLLTDLKEHSNLLFYEFHIKPEKIIEIRDNIETHLRNSNYNEALISRVMMLVEEIFMFVFDLNENKNVMGECTIILKSKSIEIIEKDNGKMYDLSNGDLAPKSLRIYLISNMTNNWSLNTKYQITIGYNRNVFEV